MPVFRNNFVCLFVHVYELIYFKVIFRKLMLAQFLQVLIQVLVQRSHDLLQEEIVIMVYNMAAVDFDGFYANFLPQFLSSCDWLDDNQKKVLSQNFKLEKVGVGGYYLVEKHGPVVDCLHNVQFGVRLIQVNWFSHIPIKHFVKNV